MRKNPNKRAAHPQSKGDPCTGAGPPPTVPNRPPKLPPSEPPHNVTHDPCTKPRKPQKHPKVTHAPARPLPPPSPIVRRNSLRERTAPKRDEGPPSRPPPALSPQVTHAPARPLRRPSATLYVLRLLVRWLYVCACSPVSSIFILSEARKRSREPQ